MQEGHGVPTSVLLSGRVGPGCQMAVSIIRWVDPLELRATKAGNDEGIGRNPNRSLVAPDWFKHLCCLATQARVWEYFLCGTVVDNGFRCIAKFKIFCFSIASKVVERKESSERVCVQ